MSMWVAGVTLNELSSGITVLTLKCDVWVINVIASDGVGEWKFK